MSYIVQVDAIVCAAPVFVYNVTQSTTPGKTKHSSREINSDNTIVHNYEP